MGCHIQRCGIHRVLVSARGFGAFCFENLVDFVFDIQQLGLSKRRLPAQLDAYLARRLPQYVREAIQVVLRQKERSDGWIAWQQRFLEDTYFAIRDVQMNLATHIRDLADLGGIPVQPLSAGLSPRFRPRSQALLGNAMVRSSASRPDSGRRQTRSRASRRAFPSGAWERGSCCLG